MKKKYEEIEIYFTQCFKILERKNSGVSSNILCSFI